MLTNFLRGALAHGHGVPLTLSVSVGLSRAKPARAERSWPFGLRSHDAEVKS